MDGRGFVIPIIILIAAAAIIIAGVALFAYFGSDLGSAMPKAAASEPERGAVVVIGAASPNLSYALSGKEAMMAGIKYALDVRPDQVSHELLKHYSVVILQGDPYFGMGARELIGEYVDGGGRLIVVGDAGSKHPDYPNVAGWSWPGGAGIPVPAEMIGEWAGRPSVSNGSEILITDAGHPVVNGLKTTGTRLNMTSRVFQVLSNGKTILAITTSDGKTLPAVIEGGSGLGDVLYFAYDPGETPEVLLAAVKYMAGI